MKGKKLLAGVLSAAMVLGTMALPVFADGEATALPAADENGIITLTEDVTLSEPLVIEKDTTIKLDGHKITSPEVKDDEAEIATLITVGKDNNSAELTVIGPGTIEPGTRTNIENYNKNFYTIEALDNTKVIIDGAVIKGSRGINTKYGGGAIHASNAEITIQNKAEIYGGDSEKASITSDNKESWNYKYQGEAGDAVYVWHSRLTVTDSKIYGGNGISNDDTEKSYISGGINFATGGVGISASQSDTLAIVTGSFIKGGDSTLYNAADGIYVGFGASLTMENSEVEGGSCLKCAGTTCGIAGNGISVPMDACTVAIKNSEVTGGNSDGSWIGSGIEVTNNATGSTVKVEDSQIAAGGGAGKTDYTYAIKTGYPTSVELKNTSLTANKDKKKAVDERTKFVIADGTLTVVNGELNVEVYTNSDVTVSGDDTVTPKKIAAKIGDALYESLADAAKAAQDGDTITLLADAVVPTEKNSPFNAGVTVDLNEKSLTFGSTPHGDYFVRNVTLKNGNINIEGFKAGTVALGTWQTDAKLTLDGVKLTAKNMSGTYLLGGTGAVEIKNSEIIAEDNNTIKSLIASNGGDIIIENSKITHTNSPGNTIYQTTGDVTIKGKSEITSDNVGCGIFMNYFTEAGNVNIEATGDDAPVINITNINSSSKYNTEKAGIVLGAKSGYTPDNKATVNATVYRHPDSTNLTNTIDVTLENVTKNDGEKVYDLYLNASDNKTINRLTTAEFTFALTTSDDINYEVIGATNVTVTPDNAVAGKYGFNFDGVKDADKTGAKIKLAQIKFTGYGTFSFEITGDKNAVHAAALNDNIVTDFIANPDSTKANEGTLTTYSAKLTDVEIKKPLQELTVNVTFNNSIFDQVKAYQKMKAVISGGDLTDDVTVDFGSDAKALNGNVYSFTKELTKNTTYTVTVSGEGYRTARYTVTMTGNKTLNFWNNVKDTAINVEEGVTTETTKKDVTFLAGDIVKDGKINIYDLSAVVSYFGTINNVDAESEYAKYDLNRDGKIDSKDVAYVLVSWDK